MSMTIKSIQVLGSGCPSCQRLYETAQKAVQDLNLSVTVEYSTDIQKILDLGLMSSPVLVINGRPVAVGTLPNLEKIKELLSASA